MPGFFLGLGVALGWFGTFLGLPGWAVMAAGIAVLVVSGQFRKEAEPGVPLGR